MKKSKENLRAEKENGVKFTDDTEESESDRKKGKKGFFFKKKSKTKVSKLIKVKKDKVFV